MPEHTVRIWYSLTMLGFAGVMKTCICVPHVLCPNFENGAVISEATGHANDEKKL